jgi:hypothetical protein
VVQGVEDRGRKRMPRCNGADRAVAQGDGDTRPERAQTSRELEWAPDARQRVDQGCVKGRCGREHD